MSQLTELDISHNRVGCPPYEPREQRRLGAKTDAQTQSLPMRLGQLRMLRHLDASMNRLRGVIPASLGECHFLQRISLASNELRGPIPHTLCECPELAEIVLHSNRLDGHIPAQFGCLKRLQVLDLSYNKLTGHIPDWVGEGPKGQRLVLFRAARNKLTGVLPRMIQFVTDLDLRWNSRLQGLFALRVFKEVDTDGSGMIDLDEFKALVERCGLRVPLRVIRNAFREVDVDDSGELDFSEFLRAMSMIKFDIEL